MASASQPLRPAELEFLRSFFAHQELRNFIANDSHNHPEADVRLRFPRARRLRSDWFEWKTLQQQEVVEGYKSMVSANTVDLEAGHTFESFEKAMTDLDKWLDNCSRALEQDSYVAQAPAVEPYFMDKGFRDKIMLAGVSLAPNGLPVEFYGSKGDPTTGLTALRGHEDSFFRRLILYKLAIPFNHHIYSPLKNITHRILCRPVSHRQHGLSGRMLLGMVAALESLVGVCLVAVSVIILHNAASMRNQLIATSLLSLAFPYIVIFLSADAFRLFTLTATFWAVAVVFISANYGGRSNRE